MLIIISQIVHDYSQYNKLQDCHADRVIMALTDTGKPVGPT